MHDFSHLERSSSTEERSRKWHRGGILRTSLRLRADGIFGLDASAPVGHRLDQLADLLARPLIAQVHLLVEESGSAWHQHLWVGYHDGTDTTEHTSQGGPARSPSPIYPGPLLSMPPVCCAGHCDLSVATPSRSRWPAPPAPRRCTQGWRSGRRLTWRWPP